MPQASRAFRQTSDSCESPTSLEAVPFLHDASGQQSLDLDPSELEEGILSGDKEPRIYTQSCHESDDDLATCFTDHSSRVLSSKWEWRTRIHSLYKLVFGSRRHIPSLNGEKTGRRSQRRRPSGLRRALRAIAWLLMLLGFIHFVALACGLWLTFFPEELPWPENYPSSGRFPEDLGHWPTDITADINPVACHSHNDYWRKEPLFSALHVGCTSVEADVWLFNEDLYVGHSTASLTPARTLRSLYIDPLLNILDKTNPITSFHPRLKLPRNGVFDTDATQSLVLLIDFKTNGETLWPYVSSQLQPLRDRNYLTYFNGSEVVEGPITVVATGNAPFNKVVENQSYRDIFFDAPLDLMDKVPPQTSPSHRISDEQHISPAAETATGGQGHSESAPTNPLVYSVANSYFASVSFKRSVLGFPTLPPWRTQMTASQIELIRKQIAGAHARGLKVRYWSVPDWPRGLRNYFWRVLVKEGVDYLNVDDLKAATTQSWVGKNGWEGRERGWWFTWS